MDEDNKIVKLSDWIASKKIEDSYLQESDEDDIEDIVSLSLSSYTRGYEDGKLAKWMEIRVGVFMLILICSILLAAIIFAG
jgi:hypothetical protein